MRFPTYDYDALCTSSPQSGKGNECNSLDALGNYGDRCDIPEINAALLLRYVALNPVRARLVDRAEDWRWSSVRTHIAGEDDLVVGLAPDLDRGGDFRAFLAEEFDEAFTYAALRKDETLGRPVGSVEWLEAMAAKIGLTLLPKKRGPKPKPDGRHNSGMSHLSP